VQTRRSFLRMAGKISPMPTASTDPNSELTHNFNPSFQKKWPPYKNREGKSHVLQRDRQDLTVTRTFF
jgi:hypothetical protein